MVQKRNAVGDLPNTTFLYSRDALLHRLFLYQIGSKSMISFPMFKETYQNITNGKLIEILHGIDGRNYNCCE